MDRQRIQELVEMLEASSAAEISVCEGDSFVRIRRTINGVAVESEDSSASATGEPSTAAPTPTEAELVVVQAKLVGTFHLKHQGEATPLAEPGTCIAEGQVVGALEALGKWTDVISPVAGEVVEIVAPDDSPVHYGDVLMRIKAQEESQ